jgi:hypothetical protein
MEENEQPGLRPIGALTSNVVSLLRPSNSMSMTSSPNSATIGSPSPETPPNSTGTRRGGPGVAVRPNALAEALAGEEAWRTDKALLAALPQRVAQRLDSRLNSESDIIEYILREGCDLDEIETALAIVEETCRPSPGDFVVEELAKVVAVTVSRGRDEIDEEFMYVTMASLLVEFPPDVIKDACISYMKCEKWRPSLAEIRDRCWQRFRARKSLRATLRLAVDRASRAQSDRQGGRG